MTIRQQISQKLREAKNIGADFDAIRQAQFWFIYGTRYSNEDMDVLQSLRSAIERKRNEPIGMRDTEAGIGGY